MIILFLIEIILIIIFSTHLPWVDRHGIFCFRDWKWRENIERACTFIWGFQCPQPWESMKRQVTWRSACYLFLNPTLHCCEAPQGVGLKQQVKKLDFWETLWDSRQRQCYFKPQSPWFERKAMSALLYGNWPPSTPQNLTTTLEIGRQRFKWTRAFPHSRARGGAVGCGYGWGPEGVHGTQWGTDDGSYVVPKKQEILFRSTKKYLETKHLKDGKRDTS